MTTAAGHPPSMVSIKFHSGDYAFDDKRDLEFLNLLADEIQDDHVMVITEGLQIQKALASSFHVVAADTTDIPTEVSDEKMAVVAPLRSGNLIVDDADDDTKAADSEKFVSYLAKDLPVIAPYSDDEDVKKSDIDEDDEDSDAKLGVNSTEICDDFAVVEEMIAVAAADDTPPLLDASDSPKNFVPISSALFSDSAAPKSDEISKSAASSAATGTCNVDYPNDVVPNSSLNAVFDDFTPKEQIWTFCELCGVVQDNQRTLIKVHGCEHSFCNYCFEMHSVSQLGSKDEAISMIKCPVEWCFNEITYDHCVALLLQHDLDNASKAPVAVAVAGQSSSSNDISDNWDFVDVDSI